ncbi:MAG: membrane complex biogenesis BtpA family protein [Planctomycetota bacterium]|jgi:membrane complex biogenesis BtpA family protein
MWNSIDGPPLVGVVHLKALPGAPGYQGSVPDILRAARQDAVTLVEAGFRRVIVENFGDVPFHAGSVPPETVAVMALALNEIRALDEGLELGVNVLRNDARAALALCAATGASFLRVNVFVGAAVTDQGLIQGCAAKLVRERARLAPGIKILADVHVKHAAPLANTRIEDEALDAIERGLADAVIVSGAGTGGATSMDELQRVADAVGRERVLVGSGATTETLPEILRIAGGAIVGTATKQDGDVSRPVELERCQALIRSADSAR